MPREYDEFEHQEPFLDVPIPFETALPKGFKPLSPLLPPAAASSTHDMTGNDWHRFVRGPATGGPYSFAHMMAGA